MRAVHLDHAASTPVRPEVLATFTEVAGRLGGNPMSGHAAGRAARTVLEEARERLAVALGRSPHEVVFTSGATEADQLAVVGLARAAAKRGRRHVVCSAVEHPAVRDAVRWLVAHEGASVTWVPPEGTAPIAPEAVAAAVREDTGLVTVTAADGEVGVRERDDVADAAHDRGVAVHRDAAQRLPTGPVPPTGAVALSGHKLGGPVGIGAALLPRGLPVAPLVDGPGQERGLRSGTPPAALAHALAVAVELTVREWTTHTARCRGLAARLAAGLAAIDGVEVTGPAPDDPDRLASHVHATACGVDGEALATALDAEGVAVSTGTACATGTARPSPVLAARGIVADAAMRLSLGRTTTVEEVDEGVAVVADVVETLRAAGGGFL